MNFLSARENPDVLGLAIAETPSFEVKGSGAENPCEAFSEEFNEIEMASKRFGDSLSNSLSARSKLRGPVPKIA